MSRVTIEVSRKREDRNIRKKEEEEDLKKEGSRKRKDSINKVERMVGGRMGR